MGRSLPPSSSPLNEEARMAAAIKPPTDRWTRLDGGPTDHTRVIAEALGAKVHFQE